MRTIASAVVGCLVLSSVAVSAEPVKAEDVLAAKVPYLRASGDWLEGVFRDAARFSGRNVFVNWKALEASGVPRTLPMTLDLSGLTLGQTMTRIVENLNTPGSHATIGFTVDEGVVTVSTTEDLAKNVETRTYDIRAWIPAPVAAAPNAPAPKEVDPKVRQAAVDKMLARVLGIQPRTWKANGGNIGTVRELGGQLIVTHTPAVQRLVAAELELSAAEKTEAVLQTIIPEVQLDAVRFADTIAYVAQASNVGIDVEWKELESLGIRLDSPVTLRGRNLRLLKVLQVAIDNVAGTVRIPASGLSAPRRFVLPNGRILITTMRDMLARFGETKRYPVGSLLEPEKGFATQTRKEMEESITSLIMDCIAVETWAQQPGQPGGSMTYDDDTLVVYADVSTQRQVQDLLKKLGAPALPSTTQPSPK